MPFHISVGVRIAGIILSVIMGFTLVSGATRVAQGSQATAVVTGAQHTCALTTGGAVKCWGHNGRGQLGDGTTTDRSYGVPVSGLSSGVTAIATGGWHTCALTTAGAVKCWGFNVFGQLGDGTSTNRTSPVDVSGLTSGVTSIAAGLWQTCAVTSGGAVKCWGFNSDGQLGDATTTSRTTPVAVSGLSSGITAVSAGGWHTCALTSASGVKCWGDNFYGQLGDGSTNDRTTPVDVSGLTSGVASIEVGENHSCAVTTAGGAKCWGQNDSGQIGDGSTTSRSSPVDVSGLTSGVASIAGGGAHTCARTTGSGAKCWGWDSWGQLGDGSTTGFLEYRTTADNVSGLTSGVSAISTGSGHSCALTSGGVIRCWGWNSVGQLGAIQTNGQPEGETLAAPGNMDLDRDGCRDERELQTGSGSEDTGGRRNPKLFWDFFDVPTGSPLARDRVVSVGDVSAVQARFGSSGDPNGDPLSTPPPTGYHTAYDRTGPSQGQDPWDTNAPNGSITIQDISLVNTQSGDTCL